MKKRRSNIGTGIPDENRTDVGELATVLATPALLNAVKQIRRVPMSTNELKAAWREAGERFEGMPY